ncbi:MAG TPA: efflux RND transporter periplasmic adaptor subunit [Candidatus Angelobacter sp.]|nr:efflux RND transporter periplasmic adaptor subunit [Candidatus Angelobacter sp.]
MKNLLPVRFFRKRKNLMLLGGAVLVLAACGLAFRRASLPSIPTAEARLGDFVDYISVRGSIKAVRSIQLTAPSAIGGDLQIIKLAPTGTLVKKGDVVVQFDTTTLQHTLEQKQSELKSADAEIEHTRAEGRLTQEQQATDLLQGRFDVDRAKLDASKQEILSEIEGAETQLKLADAEQKLKELQQRETSSKNSAEAEINGKKHKREKALFDVQKVERQIASLTLRTPSDGMVTLLPNFRTHNWMSGGSAADFKEGDRAWAGAGIAEIPDLSSVRLSAHVDESDRGQIKVEQPAEIRIDAVAGKEFKGSVAEISPLAKLDYSSWPFTKNFGIDLQVLEGDSSIRPGMSASGRIVIERIPNSVIVPTQVVFDKNGRSVVYVLHGSGFEERPVQVARRTKAELLIANGLHAGEKVARQDPTQPGKLP